MAGTRFLDVVRLFAPYMPSVVDPQRKVPFKQKLVWTSVVLLIFLVMGEMPLYGLTSADNADPLMWLRMMTASNRGTLMELGITPLVTSSMVLQLLVGTGLLDVDNTNANDQAALGVAQKLLALVLAVGQATSYVFMGMYGVPSSLGAGVVLLLIAQLCTAGVIVILLDELIQKGYGLGSGSQLFITTNVCEQVLWKAFSPTTINSGRGYEMEGAVVSLVHLLATRRNKKHALVEAFTRTNLPNMSQVLVTVVVFFIVLFLQTLRYDLPIRSAQAQGNVGTIPVRLFYTSNTPIMLQSALLSNMFLLSQLLFSRYPDSWISRIVGRWDARSGTGSLTPVSGLMYYLNAPESILEALKDPIRTVSYVLVVITLCAVFSSTWTEISRTDAKSLARQFKSQGITIAGREGSVYKTLKQIIPTAAVLGGITIGVLSIVCDLLGTLGQGTGILMAVTTLHGFYETAILGKQ